MNCLQLWKIEIVRNFENGKYKYIEKDYIYLVAKNKKMAEMFLLNWQTKNKFQFADAKTVSFKLRKLRKDFLGVLPGLGRI